MSKVHYSAERRPEEGGDHRTDAISDHALGYRVSVACTVLAAGVRGRRGVES